MPPGSFRNESSSGGDGKGMDEWIPLGPTI